MHKRASLGLAALLALAVAAPANAAFTQTFDMTLSSKKTNSSTGFTAKLASSDPTAPNGKPKAVTNARITFPAGTKFDTSVPAVCTLTPQQLSANPAPCAAAQIGTGTAKANAKPVVPVDLEENVTAYNAKNGILFLLRPKTALGQTFALQGKLSGRVLNVPVPKLQVFGVDVVLTDFQVSIGADRKGRGKAAKYYARTPLQCTGKWTTTAALTYNDGSSLSVKSTKACTKPKKRS